jgi:hypothetical protein
MMPTTLPGSMRKLMPCKYRPRGVVAERDAVQLDDRGAAKAAEMRVKEGA